MSGPKALGTKAVLYLHGFRSSPLSFKSQLLGKRLAELGFADYQSPQLPASPKEASLLILQLVQQQLQGRQPTDLTVVGSSLGGYYATWLAEKIGCKAVLLNPGTNPTKTLAGYVGEHKMWHSDEPFVFKPEYLDELTALATGHITDPSRYFLVAATGDELLNWRDMVDRYPGAHQLIIEGSDHAMSDFEDYVGQVIDFVLK